MTTEATHAAVVRNTLAVAVLAEIDSESGRAILELQTAANAEVATLQFMPDAAGSVIAEVLTFDTISSDTNATGGITTKFEIQDALGVSCVLGTVGTVGEGINLSSVDITSGDTVSVASLTYTASL